MEIVRLRPIRKLRNGKREKTDEKMANCRDREASALWKVATGKEWKPRKVPEQGKERLLEVCIREENEP